MNALEREYRERLAKEKAERERIAKERDEERKRKEAEERGWTYEEQVAYEKGKWEMKMFYERNLYEIPKVDFSDPEFYPFVTKEEMYKVMSAREQKFYESITIFQEHVLMQAILLANREERTALRPTEVGVLSGFPKHNGSNRSTRSLRKGVRVGVLYTTHEDYGVYHYTGRGYAPKFHDVDGTLKAEYVNCPETLTDPENFEECGQAD